MNIPTKYGFGSTPKADNKIRIKGSTDYILLLCVILLVAIGIVMVSRLVTIQQAEVK